MPLKDVTAALMGDPGSSPRRHPKPDEPLPPCVKGYGAVSEGRQRNDELISLFRRAAPGFAVKVKAYYHARKVWLWGRSNGVQIEYENVPGTKKYVVRRIG